MSPTFLDDTSAPTGSLGLYVKACVLLGRVVNYLQRLPRTKCVKQGAACSAVKAHNKALPGFIELDVALSRFKESVGPRLYDAVGDGIDGFLVSAYCIPHAATILLHESFTDRYVRDPTSSLSRCLAAAKCVVNAMHVLYGSSHDLAGGDPFQPVCWSIAGRALVRDFATRRLWGDHDEAEVSKGLAEDCLEFHEVCQKGGSGIAGALAQTLRRHLSNPDMLLPMDGPVRLSLSPPLAPLPFVLLPLVALPLDPRPLFSPCVSSRLHPSTLSDSTSSLHAVPARLVREGGGQRERAAGRGAALEETRRRVSRAGVAERVSIA